MTDTELVTFFCSLRPVQNPWFRKQPISTNPVNGDVPEDRMRDVFEFEVPRLPFLTFCLNGTSYNIDPNHRPLCLWSYLRDDGSTNWCLLAWCLDSKEHLTFNVSDISSIKVRP